jgi:hypothetical protein
MLFENGSSSVFSCSFSMSKADKKFVTYQSKSLSDDKDFKYVVMRSVLGIMQDSAEQPTADDTEDLLKGRQSKTQDDSSRNSVTNNSRVSTSTFSEQDGLVYIFGYHITRVGDKSCLVTAISQFSSDFHRLEIDYSFCRKLKHFIEELTKLTDLQVGNQMETESTTKRFFANGEEVRDKLVIFSFLNLLD